MASFLEKLPTILILAVLVGIFMALRRHVNSTRLKLWTLAWGMIFIHFFVAVFEPREGRLEDALYAINFGSLHLAAMIFIISLTSFLGRTRKVWSLLGITAVPILIYTVAYSFDWNYRVLYIACLAISMLGSPLFVLKYRRPLTRPSLAWMPLVIGIALWSIYRAAHHDFTFGFLAISTLGFAMPGFLFWTRYRRLSPGVITTAGGFFLWGAVFPVAQLQAAYLPSLPVPPELWNVPKFFVALGMILTMLEDKSAVFEAANQREHKLNEQLQKFASITSRLLTGVEVNSLCTEIAHAITETSNFRRAAIILSADDKAIYVAGHSGLTNDAVKDLKKRCAELKIEHVSVLCRRGGQLGPNSYQLMPGSMENHFLRPSSEDFPNNPWWEHGCELLVPLQSSRGAFVGCIALDDPRDVNKVSAEEMSKIELLAGDLAVTIGNTTLHRQLVRSEKLAAIGQLVAGVAHELNNPLASVVGYAELLGDEISDAAARQKLEKLVREAHRMKRIIENLLRFARQNSLEKKSANLEMLLHEVLSLREYHIRNHDVHVQLDIDTDLPQVGLDEDQFKQILLNLLNNSMDALEQVSPKRIRIEAMRQGGRIVLRFEDCGPGFTDLNRAFDPFYTTKPVGKGTGLGLSICYGIVKEHGGDIYAMNVEPHGARVVLELPISETATAATAGSITDLSS